MSNGLARGFTFTATGLYNVLSRFVLDGTLAGVRARPFKSWPLLRHRAQCSSAGSVKSLPCGSVGPHGTLSRWPCCLPPPVIGERALHALRSRAYCSAQTPLRAAFASGGWASAWTLSRSTRYLLAALPPVGAMATWYLSHPELRGRHLSSNRAAAAGDLSPAAAPLTRSTTTLLTWRASTATTLSAALHTCRLILRATYLAILFAPLVLTSPFANLHPACHRAWLHLLHATMHSCGPAFIKWGQWAATRADLLPADVCAVLETLQTSAPRHPFKYTRAAIEQSLGGSVSDLFDELEEVPIASGAIAQVHRGRLSHCAAARAGHPQAQDVAVKVRHPGASSLLELDFVIMLAIARVAACIPGLRDVRLEDSLRQFGIPLRQQLDLQLEAQHLDLFSHNFRLWRHVRFPQPLWPLVSESVLVESFEEGAMVSAYVKQATPYNARIADLGLRAYLQMILQDNFVHADLHPGNIMVRVRDDAPHLPFVAAFLQPIAALFAVDLVQRTTPVEISLIDVGMTTALSPLRQRALVSLYGCIATMDGRGIARAMLELRHVDSSARCDTAGFTRDIDALFADVDRAAFRRHTQAIVGQVLECARRHCITMDGAASTVLITTLILEGWSTELNPDIRIIEAICHHLPQRWTERLPLLIDRLVASDLLDVC